MSGRALATLLCASLGACAAQECGLTDSLKADCGWYGVTASECEQKSCCYAIPEDKLHGVPWCFYPGSSPHSPTPSPPTPFPPSPSPQPSDLICETAECCKSTVKHPRDEALCDEFFNEDIGIAFTMISRESWQHQGRGWSGMDRAFFNDEPPTKVNTTIEQAVSLTHYKKGSWAFLGGRSAHGLVMSIGQEKNFWRYFWTCYQRNGHGNHWDGEKAYGMSGLMADCHDGVNHCDRNPANGIWFTMAENGYSYEQFQREKNVIVAATGNTKGCGNNNKNTYNEFDANGLSSTAFAGLFTSSRFHLPPESDETLCAFLRAAKLTRQDGMWPVWEYKPFSGQQKSSLAVGRYISCGQTNTVVV